MHCATFTKFVAVPLACFAVLSTGVTIQGQTAPQKSACKGQGQRQGPP